LGLILQSYIIEKDGSTETLRNKWYEEECKIAIEEQEYHHKRKAAHKVIRNKKKVYMNKCNRIDRRRSKA
jgi:hypothetical protein